MSALRLPRRGVYGITPAALCNTPAELFAAVETALDAGLALLQYRDKKSGSAQKLQIARGLLKCCRRAQVPLIINDDAALALAVGADGVHLGQTDVSLAAARLLLGPEAIIGITCANSLDRAVAAAAGGASYVAFGAFNASRTKPDAARPPLSLLTEAKAQLVLPVCAIGGITIDNAAPLLAAGADYLAAIDGIFGAADIAAAVRGLVALFAA